MISQLTMRIQDVADGELLTVEHTVGPIHHYRGPSVVMSVVCERCGWMVSVGFWPPIPHHGGALDRLMNFILNHRAAPCG